MNLNSITKYGVSLGEASGPWLEFKLSDIFKGAPLEFKASSVAQITGPTVTIDPTTGVTIHTLDTSGLTTLPSTGTTIQSLNTALAVDFTTGVSIGSGQGGLINATLLPNGYNAAWLQDLARSATLNADPVVAPDGLVTVGEGEGVVIVVGQAGMTFDGVLGQV